MVRIRLSRGGSKKRPFFHIVATNSRSSRDGKYIERLGFYNPRASDNEDDIRIDIERINYWESVGAQLSDKVRHLLKLLELTREERANKKNEKINKKKLIKQEKKEAAEEAPAEEPEAETKDEPDKDKNDST